MPLLSISRHHHHCHYEWALKGQSALRPLGAPPSLLSPSLLPLLSLPRLLQLLQFYLHSLSVSSSSHFPSPIPVVPSVTPSYSSLAFLHHLFLPIFFRPLPLLPLFSLPPASLSGEVCDINIHYEPSRPRRDAYIACLVTRLLLPPLPCLLLLFASSFSSLSPVRPPLLRTPSLHFLLTMLLTLLLSCSLLLIPLIFLLSCSELYA